MMIDLFIYMAKVSILTGILYSFYVLLLQKTSFHQLNRFLLLFIIPFSIICPFLEFGFTGNYNYYNLNTNYLWINELDNFSNENPIQEPLGQIHNLLQIKYLVLLVYLIGVAVFFTRSVKYFRAIYRFKRSAALILKENLISYAYLDNIKTPFTFFNWIFLPIEYKTGKGDLSIVEHEKVHVKQMHSLDLILSELYCIVFWFNPFVFLLQRSLKSIHEFIADNQVVKSNRITVEQYLGLLVSVTEMNIFYRMTSNFKSLTIKKRIEMIINNKTSNWQLGKYLLLLPVIALMIMSFSPVSNKKSEIPSISPIKVGDYDKISSEFGMRIHPTLKAKRMHLGIDFAAEFDTPIIATAEGDVVKAEFNEKGYGGMIVLNHGDGYETLYAHLKKYKVSKGDHVKKGDVIGYVGNTGLTLMPNLHYEVHKDGKAVNPRSYIKDLK